MIGRNQRIRCIIANTFVPSNTIAGTYFQVAENTQFFTKSSSLARHAKDPEGNVPPMIVSSKPRRTISTNCYRCQILIIERIIYTPKNEANKFSVLEEETPLIEAAPKLFHSNKSVEKPFPFAERDSALYFSYEYPNITFKSCILLKVFI